MYKTVGMYMRITPINIKNNFFMPKQVTRKQEHDKSFCFSAYSAKDIDVQMLSNLSFGARPAPPVYLIDKDLNCTLFTKQSELAKKLGVAPQRISGCLNGRNPFIDKNVIVYHHQVEKELDDGTKVIDKKKVAEIYNQRTKPRAVYAIDYLGNITKYESVNEIESKKGLFLLPAKGIESFDDEGQLLVNKKEIALNMLNNPNYFAIYTRDENGHLKKYETQSAFAQEHGISRASVNAAICGRIKNLCGFNIIPATLVETVTENGDIIVDKQKMIEYLSKNVRDEKVFYAVSPNLKYRRFDTQKALAETFGLDYASMMKSPRKTTPTGDYIIEASEIEEFDDNFKLVVNKSKLAKIVAERISQETIYVIDIYMNISKYDNIDSASQALNRKPSTVRMTLWKPELHKSVSDRVVVRASEIEIIDENGEVSIDKRKVSQMVQDRLCKDAVYLIDNNGECKKFRNRYSVTKAYGCSPSSSQNVRINGYVMVDASMIDEISEDGSISQNKEKVAQYAQMSMASF